MNIIGKTVSGVVDRPLGSRHPDYPDHVYEVNYGYATEAAKATIRFAAEHFDVKKFCSSYCEPNTASGRVMQKCGLHFTGYGEFAKLDGSCPMRSIEYEGDISDMRFINT